MERQCCLITLLLILHENGKNSVLACTGMGTNQTFHEEVTIKENTQADLNCKLGTENNEMSKESAFVIEIRLCDNGKYHDVCRCRWLPDKDAVCKNQRNVSICEADNTEMRFSLTVNRNYSDILWELYRSNLTPVVLKKSKLKVIYPARVTVLQVNGQEVTETHVVDENQEVSVLCFFINGYPPVTIRLVDSTGLAQSTTTHGVEPLVISLGVFRCQEVWPIIKCEAPGSELNKSVAIIGRCPPQLFHTDNYLLDLTRLLEEGLTIRLRSYTGVISKCVMTKFPPKPNTKEVACDLSGSAPDFILTLNLATEPPIGEGIWMLRVFTELGDSNITFVLTNSTSKIIGVCETVSHSGTNHIKMNEIFCFFLLLIVSAQANSTKTECIASEITAIRCIFPKNMNSTRTDFTVYFYSADGKADLLVDCAWVGDQLQCIEQEGFKCKRPVSDVADISVPTRFLSFSGTYGCIPEGSSSEMTILCTFHFKNQSEQQEEQIQDESQREGNLKIHDDKAAESSTEEIVGAVFGVVAFVLLTMVGVFMYKKFFQKNNNIRTSSRTTLDDEYCSLTENKRKIEETKSLGTPYPSASSRQRSSSLRKQFEDNNTLVITGKILNVKRKPRSDTL